MPGDVAGFVTGEKPHGGSDIRRLAHALERNVREKFIFQIRRQAFGHGGLDEAGRYGVYSDVAAAHLLSDGLCESDQARLRRDVVGLARISCLSDHGGNIYNSPPALAHHSL